MDQSQRPAGALAKTHACLARLSPSDQTIDLAGVNLQLKAAI